jgi:hypothetical protein
MLSYVRLKPGPWTTDGDETVLAIEWRRDSADDFNHRLAVTHVGDGLWTLQGNRMTAGLDIVIETIERMLLIASPNGEMEVLDMLCAQHLDPTLAVVESEPRDESEPPSTITA